MLIETDPPQNHVAVAVHQKFEIKSARFRRLLRSTPEIKMPPLSRRLPRNILILAGLSSILMMPAMRLEAKLSPEAQGFNNACMRETSASNEIRTADRTIYTCWGSVAQSYFDYLVSANTRETVDRQETGTYIFREIPETGRCWHKIAIADEVSIYGCSINVFKSAN
jgi:hypothetical protein